MTGADPYRLERFVSAQDAVLDAVLAELAAGRKRTHWMWFVFPQLKGLGLSSTARFYGLTSLGEAQAYLAHPVLGPRLRRTVAAVMASPAVSLRTLFGSPDDLKFCSCVTLFDAAEPDSLFMAALTRWCDGERDARTLALLGD